MTLLILVSAAFAAAPPPRPELPPAVEDRLLELPEVCQEEIQLRAGEQAPCRGVLSPPLWLAEDEQLVRHVSVLEGLYQVDTLRLELERDAALQHATELGAELAQRPLVERPAVAFGAGVLGGAALAVGVAWALPVR